MSYLGVMEAAGLSWPGLVCSVRKNGQTHRCVHKSPQLLKSLFPKLLILTKRGIHKNQSMRSSDSHLLVFHPRPLHQLLELQMAHNL